MNQIKNFALLIINFAAMAVVLPLLEYDLSKSIVKNTTWLPTNSALDIFLISIISIITIYNISVLFFVFIRQLPNYRRWLWLSSSIAWILVAILVLVLGNSFLPIYFPALQ